MGFIADVGGGRGGRRSPAPTRNPIRKLARTAIATVAAVEVSSLISTLIRPTDSARPSVQAAALVGIQPRARDSSRSPSVLGRRPSARRRLPPAPYTRPSDATGNRSMRRPWHERLGEREQAPFGRAGEGECCVEQEGGRVEGVDDRAGRSRHAKTEHFARCVAATQRHHSRQPASTGRLLVGASSAALVTVGSIKESVTIPAWGG
jgi:hypothetical protein